MWHVAAWLFVPTVDIYLCHCVLNLTFCPEFNKPSPPPTCRLPLPNHGSPQEASDNLNMFQNTLQDLPAQSTDNIQRWIIDNWAVSRLVYQPCFPHLNKANAQPVLMPHHPIIRSRHIAPCERSCPPMQVTRRLTGLYRSSF
ncbi:hypothetical protein KVR01_002481 [Diaporthe batatas]|uniref:uncharacterized protein n=1 Tax=Diaporthe batatas TaxID=748121 RepID=UPI001D042477|nr:uncharacterized protein KVR01_002481 [Diaporthe batatas]KAG8166792.1 hypothetical protein KVR01_002481 [Diaporthe batatas]